mgnify:CR=1 FL=1
MNIKETHKWWSIFVGEGNITEIRILGRFQYSGYFKSADSLLNAIQPYLQMDDEQCYFTLNTINEACYGRQQCEKFVKSPKATTTDNDITRRKWLLLDFDPKRAAGVNASEAEFELAHRKAQEVFAYLRKQGFADPVICISGNGWHLLYRIDLPNTSDITATVKDFLKSLSMMFSDDKVDIDEKVFNAGRICKLYGTTAKKGANLPDRPWRESKFVYIPKEISNVPLEKIQQVANLLPKEEPKQTTYHGGYNERFDLQDFLNRHSINYKQVQSSDGTRYIIDHCLFDENHKGKDAVLFQYNTGAVAYKCLHNSCSSKTWRDVRLLFEPNAYDHENQPRQPQYRQYVPQVPQKPKYEIKEEIPELGDKWLTSLKIKRLDLTNIEKVKTGFTELDKGILGLNMKELTVLSGSNSSGKSAWLNNLLLNIIQQGYKTALWSGELPSEVLKSWINMVAAGRRNIKPSQYANGKYYIPQYIEEKIDMWYYGKYYIYNNEYGTKWAQIFNDMDILLGQGVKVFILDNLMALDIDINGDKNASQSKLVLQIKNYAEQNKVHIILVAHPRKTTSFLRKYDISGTGDLTHAADNCFIMHRVNNDFLKTGAEYLGHAEIQRYQGYGNVLEVCKNRMWGVQDYFVGMHYEIESRRFKNTIDEDIHYGWEDGLDNNLCVNPASTLVQSSASQYNDNALPWEIDDNEEPPF